MPRFTYVHAGKTHIVDIEPQPEGGWRAIVDGVEHRVDALRQADGGWRLRVDSDHVTAHVAAQDERRFVWLPGEQFVLEAATRDKARRKGSTAAGDGRLTAQMPGQVRLVLVETGAQVIRGQLLLVLEAMKMELRVTAPLDGTVQQVYVAPGDVVERDALLIELHVPGAS